MSVLVNILTTYNGAGAKKAMRDMAGMQKQATLAGDSMSASLLGASAAMQRTGAKTAATGRAMSKSVTKPVLGLAAASVYAAEKVEKGLSRVRAGTGATGKSLESLEASFRTVAANSGKDLETVGDAIADVNTRLGLTGKPLETVTAQFLTLSRVTGEDVSSMLTEVSRAANDAGVKSGEMSGFLDKLLVASQATGASVSSLTADMYRYGSPLRQVGFSIDETIATLGSFDKAGVNTKLVMGSLRIALGKMAKAGETDLAAGLARGVAEIKNAKTGGEAAAKAIELFGARAGPDMAAAIREGRFEVADLIKQLEGSAGAVERTGEATKTFTDKLAVLRNKAALAGSGFGVLLLPALEKMVDVAGRVVSWLQGLDGGTRKWVLAIALAAAALGPLLIVIGKLITGAGAVVGVVGKLSLAFGKGNKAAPAWARGIAGATKGLAAFVKQGALAIVSITRQAAKWVAETAAKTASTAATLAHSAATKAAAAAQWLLNAALTANPIGIIILAIVALVAVVVVLWKRCAWFRDFWKAVWREVVSIAKAVWGWIKPGIEAIWTGIKGVWNAIWRATQAVWARIGSFIVDYVKGMWAAFKFWFGVIKTIVETVWSGIEAVTRKVWPVVLVLVRGFVQNIKLAVAVIKGVVGIVKAVWSGVVAVTRAVWKVVRTVVVTAIKGIVTTVQIVNKVRDVIRKAWQKVADVTRSIWAGLKRVVGGALDWMLSKVEAVYEKIQGIYEKLKSMVGAGDKKGKGLSLSSLTVPGLISGLRRRKGLAAGAWVPPRPGGLAATLAEGGEGEYVVPQSKVMRFAIAALAGSTPGSGSQTVINLGGIRIDNLHGTDRRAAEMLAREVAGFVEAKLARSGHAAAVTGY